MPIQKVNLLFERFLNSVNLKTSRISHSSTNPFHNQAGATYLVKIYPISTVFGNSTCRKKYKAP